MVMVKLLAFARVDFEQMKRTSVLSLLSLRKLEENQKLISCRKSQRKVGGRVEAGLEER